LVAVGGEDVAGGATIVGAATGLSDSWKEGGVRGSGRIAACCGFDGTGFVDTPGRKGSGRPAPIAAARRNAPFDPALVRFDGTNTPPTREGTYTRATEGAASIVNGRAAADASSGSSTDAGAGIFGALVKTSGVHR
jgi:hypothetical protein